MDPKASTVATADPQSPGAPRKLSGLKRSLIWSTPLLLLVTLFGWALSSPVGSSPDDDFHVASIWCAYGERSGLCEDRETAETERFVPASIVQMTCFAFQPKIDGSCQNGVTEEPSEDLLPVNHGNWVDGAYPPLFYLTYGAFASSNVAVAVITIRMLNSLLAVVVLSATFWALPRKLKPVLALSSALALVPLGLFTIASTNPSSWALLSAAVIFPTLLGLSETAGKRRIVLLSLFAIGLILAAGSRADAAAYAILAALTAWFLAKIRNRWITSALIAVVIIGAVSFLSSGQSSGLGGLSVDGNQNSDGSLSLVLYNLFHLPNLWLGMFTNLGWLDTAISPIALFALVFGSVGVIFTALAELSWKKGIALAIVAVAITAIPMYVLYGSNAAVGSQVQPRYILPLFVLLLAVAIVPRPTPLRFSATQLVFLVTGISGAQAVALYDQLSRYTNGERTLDLDTGNWWWGGAPVSANITLIIASLTFTVAIALLGRSYHQMVTLPTNLNSVSSPESSSTPVPDRQPDSRTADQS